MTKLITIGKYNKHLKNIFLSSFFLILTNFLYGFKFSENFDPIRVFDTDLQKKLFPHTYIHDIFRYFGIIILSIILYKCQKTIFSETKKNKYKKVKEVNQEQFNISSTIILIHNSPKIKNVNIQFIIMIITIWVIQRFLIDLFYKLGLRDLDFWMLELIIVSNLNAYMFNSKIYKHQTFAIHFNTFFCGLLKLASFLISFILIKTDNSYKNNIYLIPIGFISYIFIMFLRSYVNSKIKCFMDLKNISPLKLIMLYGIIGMVISCSICALSTFFPCKDPEFICSVNSNTNNSTYFFKNFIVYYEKLSNQNFNDDSKAYKELVIEILINILGTIFNFFHIFFYVLIIKHLTPVYIIFSNSIYYLFIEIYLLIYSLITNKILYENKNILIKHIIDISEELISLIGFIIFLELIELNFCGMNYNLRKSIMARSIIDSNTDINIDDSGLIKEEEYHEKSESSFSSEKASQSSKFSKVSEI